MSDEGLRGTGSSLARSQPERSDIPADAAPAESLAGVFGVLTGLVAIALFTAALLRPRPEPRPGQALLASWFDVGELPFGLSVTRSERLPDGVELVVLGRPEGEAGEEAGKDSGEGTGAGTVGADPTAGADRGAGSDRSEAEVDAPAEVALLHYPLARANAELARLFETKEHGDELRYASGSKRVASGQVDWGRYRAPFARVRTQRSGHTKESVRVNLSRPGFACALVATWPEGTEASIEPIEAVLAALAPPE